MLFCYVQCVTKKAVMRLAMMYLMATVNYFIQTEAKRFFRILNAVLSPNLEDTYYLTFLT